MRSRTEERLERLEHHLDCQIERLERIEHQIEQIARLLEFEQLEIDFEQSEIDALIEPKSTYPRSVAVAVRAL